MKNKIFLNKEIYQRENIEYVIDIYKEISKISLDEKDECYVVSSNMDNKILLKEFENYVIGIIGKYGF